MWKQTNALTRNDKEDVKKHKQVLVQNVIVNSQATSFMSELRVVQNCVKGQRNVLQRFSSEMLSV